MADHPSRPAQFRLPAWAQEFVARESSDRGVSKTDIVLDALDCLKRTRLQEDMKRGYLDMAEEDARMARGWEPALMDGLEDEEW